MSVFNGPTGVGPTVSTSILANKLVIEMGNKIAYLEPDRAPLLRLLTPSNDGKGNLRKEAVYNPKFEWLEQEGVPRWDTINYGAGYNGATVTSIVVANGSYFAAGWRIYVPRTGAILNVVSVSTNTLTIVSYNFSGTGVNAALIDTDPLLILQHTATEGATTLPTIILSQEAPKYNYTEIVKTCFGVTNTMKNTNIYGGKSELEEQRFLKGIEHALAIEHRLLFGQRAIVTSGSNAERSTGGLLYWITTNITTDTGSLTETEFNTWLYTFFKYGSEQKIVLCGNNIVDSLNAFPSGKVRINDMLTKKYGMNINEWISPYGTAYLIYHRLLYGTVNGKRAVGVDLKNVSYKYMNGRDTNLELNVQNPGDDITKDQYLTEAGLEVRLDKTHAILNIA